jgi:uncharacterized protein (DUF58 family)
MMSAVLRALPEGMRERILGDRTSALTRLSLDRRRVFILPTPAGLLFGLIGLTIWFTSLNFNLQLGFFLSFLVLSIALVSMYETHRNLIHLSVRELRCVSVHAGEVADFEFAVENFADKPRYAIRLAFMLPRRRRRGAGRGVELAMPGIWIDVAASSTVTASVGLPTRRRGERVCPRVRISTRFPFGLWEAWAYARPGMKAIVYPAAEADAPPLPRDAEGDRSGAAGASAGTDDFGGVRSYHPGDPLRAVAWRLAARSDQLSVKLFESTAGEQTLLDFSRLPESLSVEQRLSRLTSWVIAAEAGGVHYGLALPGARIAPSRGPEQRARCLKALALYAPGD